MAKHTSGAYLVRLLALGCNHGGGLLERVLEFTLAFEVVQFLKVVLKTVIDWRDSGAILLRDPLGPLVIAVGNGPRNRRSKNPRVPEGTPEGRFPSRTLRRRCRVTINDMDPLLAGPSCVPFGTRNVGGDPAIRGPAAPARGYLHRALPGPEACKERRAAPGFGTRSEVVLKTVIDWRDSRAICFGTRRVPWC